MRKNKKLVDKTLELLRYGYSEIFILNQIQENIKGRDALSQAKEILSQACKTIKEEHSHKHQEIWSLHLSRYYNEVNRLLQVEELPASSINKTISYRQWQASKNKKVKAYCDAVSTISQLQVLLQLVSTTTVVDINEKISITEHNMQAKWDCTKLILDEKRELYELIKKSKINMSEVRSISQSTSYVQANEILVEEVVQSPVNINQIMHEQSTPVHQPNISNNSDPIFKLKEGLRKAAAKHFQQIGSNLDQHEKSLLQ